MAYGLKYRNNFEGINDLTNVKYNVLLEIFQDGYAGAVTEIEEMDKNPLQFRLDNSGDAHYVPIKKTSVSINIVDTGQFDYSEFYTSNAKMYKVVITSPVLNWQGYLVPQSYNSNLNYRQPFTLTASDGLHLLSSIDYVPDQSKTVSLSTFIADVESKIGLGTFDKTTTIQTEIGNVWDALIYEGMFTDLNYEEALEMVLKSIGMQLRYWKIFPVIESYNVTNNADVQIINKDITLDFLAPIKTAKVTQNITTLPDLMLNGMVDDLSDLVESNVGHVSPFYTLSKWVADPTVGGVIVSWGRTRSTFYRDTSDYFTSINLELMPVNGVKQSFELTGNEISYFVCRPVHATPLTFSIKANFGKIAYFSGRGSASGLINSKLYPAKYTELKYGIYDEISNKSFNYSTRAWSITGRPTQANCNKLRITDPKDGDTTIYIETPATSGTTSKINFYLLGGSVEYADAMSPAVAQTMVKNILSIDAIKVDGVSLVSDKELYNETSSVVDVAPNIDVLDYEVDFGYCPSPPANTSLYYGSAFYHTNLAQILNVVAQGNTIPWLQYIYQTLLYTQNVQRKKVYTCSLLLKSVVNPIWLRTTLMGDVVMTNSLNFDWKTSQISAELTEIQPYVYSAWTITSESTIGSSDWGGSGGTSGSVGGGGGSVDLSNCVVKTGATSQDIEGNISADNIVSRGAVVAGALNGTLPDDLPVATSLLYGVVKFDPTTLALNGSNQLTVIGGGGGSDVAWGTPTAQYTPLAVDSVTRNLSLDGHTHSYLPLSGGVLTGDLYLGTQSIDKTLSVRNITGPENGQLNLNPWWGLVTANGYKIWHAGNDGAGSGLDADLLDGLHQASFLRCDSIDANDSKNAHYAIGTDSTHNFIQSHAGKPLHLNELGNYVYINNVLAATINSNVASATKLQTSRTIWGQNFNGEGNVDGLLVINKSSTDASEGQQSLVILSGVNDSKLQMGAIPSVGSYIQSMRHGSDWTSRPLMLQPNGGNVGIGTTSPQFKLDVNGNTRSNYMLFKNYNDNGLAGYVGRGASNNNNLQLLAYTGNSVYIGANENDVNGITINTYNYVGIGTTDPQYKLDVNGTFRTTGAAYLNSTLAVTGTSTFTGLLTANGGIGSTTGIFSDKIISGTAKGFRNAGFQTGFNPIWSFNNAETFGIGYYQGAHGLPGVSSDAIGFHFGNISEPSLTIDAFGGVISDSFITANRFYTGYDSGIANSFSCSNWFRSNGSSGWYNDTYGAGINSDTANVVRTYSTNKFKVYNTEDDSISTLGGIKAQSVGNDYNVAAFQALGNGAANTVFPTIGFHQPGLYASSIQLRSGGNFYFYQQGASGLANINAQVGTFSNNVVSYGSGTFAVNVSAGNAIYTDGRIFTGYDANIYNSISCSNWFRSNGATGWLNATYMAGILSDTANIVRTYNTNKFKVYNTAIDSILTLGGVTAANVVSSGAVVAGALNGTLPDDLPLATTALFGVSKYSGLAIQPTAGDVALRTKHYTSPTANTWYNKAYTITYEIGFSSPGSLAAGAYYSSLYLYALPTAKCLACNITVIPYATGTTPPWIGQQLIASAAKDSTGYWRVFIYNPTSSSVYLTNVKLSIIAQMIE